MSYHIRDLEQLSGIKAHTIRIWEKRYDLIAPSRTDTKIRVYSDEDLKKIMNVATLNRHGWKISKIAKLTEEEVLQEVQKISEEGVQKKVDITDEMILNVIHFNREAIFEINQKFITKFGLVATILDFYFPFLERIGVLWQTGTINPAQEHYCSNIIRNSIIQQTENLQATRNKGKVLLFLAEHELHELGLLALNYILLSKGYDTFMLGQALPLEDLLKTIPSIQPDYVVSAWVKGVDMSVFEEYHKETLKLMEPNTIFYTGAFLDNNPALKLDIQHRQVDQVL